MQARVFPDAWKPEVLRVVSCGWCGCGPMASFWFGGSSVCSVLARVSGDDGAPEVLFGSVPVVGEAERAECEVREPSASGHQAGTGAGSCFGDGEVCAGCCLQVA